MVPVEKGWLFGRRVSKDGPLPGSGQSTTGAGRVPVTGVTGETQDPTAGSPNEFAVIPLELIAPNPFQPRALTPGGEGLEELAESIRTHGLLQPVLVTRHGDGYLLVAGERRWQAAKLAGLSRIPAMVGVYGERELAENALIENLQRKDLTCLEEAEAYRRLLEEFSLTQDDLAHRIGRSQPAVANKLRLLRLPEEIRQSISREIITEGHARALLMLESPELQQLACAEIVSHGLSVRQAEELVRGMAGGARRRQRERRRQVVRVFKDARLFRNSLLSLVGQMRQGGAVVEVEETAENDYYEVHLRVHRKPAAAGGPRRGASDREDVRGTVQSERAE